MVPVKLLLSTGLLVPTAQVSLMPQPSTIGLPVTSSQRWAVPSDAAMPPAWVTHRLEKSMVLNVGCSSKALNRVLTAGKMWKGRFFRVVIKAVKSRGLGTRVMWAPRRTHIRQVVRA